MNDECQFTTTIHIDSIDSGITLQSFGLTHTEAVFESYPVGFPLDTFRVQQDGNGNQIGDAFLTLATSDYLLDGQQKIIIVLVESVGGLSPELIQFQFTITYQALYCDPLLTLNHIATEFEYEYRIGDPAMTIVLDGASNGIEECGFTMKLAERDTGLAID